MKEEGVGVMGMFVRFKDDAIDFIVDWVAPVLMLIIALCAAATAAMIIGQGLARLWVAMGLLP